MIKKYSPGRVAALSAIAVVGHLFERGEGRLHYRVTAYHAMHLQYL